MKRIVFAIAIATVAAGGSQLYGQRGGNPFVDHSDTGETVHVLPAPASVRSPHDTQPTDASSRLTVYPPSYGSGNLVDHGGHEIPSAGFYAIYWNSTVADSGGAQGNATLHDTVQNFVLNFSNSADYTVIQQYGSRDAIAASLMWAGELVDTRTTQSSISDSKIRSYLASLFQSGRVTANANTIYGMYFPSGMKITLQGGTSCSAFCGYHGHFTYNTQDIKYAVFPYTDCRGCSLSGKAVADMLTIVSSHEIREAATDPDLNAWYDASGYEADDKCAWHNLYQMSGGHFWVQPEYSNRDKGCVVP